MSASEQMISMHQETLEQYRQLFEEAPVAYHEIDPQGIIRRVNHAECRLLEYSPEEMIGRQICDFVAPQNRDRCRRAIALKMLGAPVGKPFRRAYRTKTNREIIVEIYDQIMRDAQGEIIGVRSALIDVTEQVEAQEALMRNEQWIPRILYALPKPVVIVDPLGILTFMNPAAEQLFERESVEVLGTLFLKETAMQFENCPQYAPFSPRAILLGPWEGIASITTPSGCSKELYCSTVPVLNYRDECTGIIETWKVLSSRDASKGRSS